MLNLEAMDKSRHWQIVGCSAYTGEGLLEGFDWLVQDIASRIYMLDWFLFMPSSVKFVQLTRELSNPIYFLWKRLWIHCLTDVFLRRGWVGVCKIDIGFWSSKILDYLEVTYLSCTCENWEDSWFWTLREVYKGRIFNQIKFI